MYLEYPFYSERPCLCIIIIHADIHCSKTFVVRLRGIRDEKISGYWKTTLNPSNIVVRSFMVSAMTSRHHQQIENGVIRSPLIIPSSFQSRSLETAVSDFEDIASSCFTTWFDVESDGSLPWSLLSCVNWLCPIDRALADTFVVCFILII